MMKPLTMDFNRQSLPNRRWWWILAIVTLVAASAAGVSWHERSQVSELRNELHEARVNQGRAPVQVRPVRGPAIYDASARTMLIERSSPWPQALAKIEATAIMGVTPGALEFMAAEHSVRVELTFSDYPKLLEYVEALNAGESTFRWTLVQSQAQVGNQAVAVVVGGPIQR